MGKVPVRHTAVAVDLQDGCHGFAGEVLRPVEIERPRDQGSVGHTGPRGADVEESSSFGQVGHDGPQVYMSRGESLLGALGREDPIEANAHSRGGGAEQIDGGSGGVSGGVGKVIGGRILEPDTQGYGLGCLCGGRREAAEEQELTDQEKRRSIPLVDHGDFIGRIGDFD